MGYFAVLKMEDEFSNDVWRMEGQANKVISSAMLFLRAKDKEFHKNFFVWLKKDFMEFDNFLKREFIWKKR